MEARHCCAILKDKVIQCVIHDGNVKDVKITGVKCILSEKLFQNPPQIQKALQHSHAHEVKSGQLIAPEILEPAEKELMKKLVGAQGKTFQVP